MSELNQPILLAELQVQFTIDGRLVAAPARVFQRLWPRPQVVFEIINVQGDPQPNPADTPGSIQQTSRSYPALSEGPSTLQLQDGTQIEVVPSSWLVHQHDAVLHLEESPSVVLNTGKPMVSLQFDVLNITRDLFHWPLALHAPPWLVSIDPVPGLEEMENALRSDMGFAVTHSGMITRSDGNGFSGDEAQFFLGGLRHFLSFVCGSQCGIANVVGVDSDGNEAWKQWGTCRVSSWERHRSWADITIKDALPDIFKWFWPEYLKSSEHLDRVIGWYVHSNETAGVDLSIVLNQIVLEVLTTLMPAGKQGQKGTRIANMLKKHSIDPQIPAYCGELVTLAKRHNYKHGPHTLVAIRNSMVHAQDKIGLPSIDAHHEAKQLGLLYVELLLLKMFKYTGGYASRLTGVQRAGDTELVPWANGGQT